ncbi:MAG: sensor histidine kinase [Chloroflexota bacterium]
MDFQTNIIFVFFIYGLAFFSMGLAMALEYGRSSLLVETRLLLPLAVFGILHGLHEWSDIILMQAQLYDFNIPVMAPWLRMSLLVISFTSLVAYGVQVLSPPRQLAGADLFVGAGLLLVYAILLIITKNTPWANPASWDKGADIFARYTLAVPGGILTGLALRRQAIQLQSPDHPVLVKRLHWAGLGFVLYGVTQFFVSPAVFFPANIFNTDNFSAATGLPIQVVRAVLAVLIMINLIHATQITEKARQNQLSAAQNERLAALQRVQDELVKREAMRQELLKHIVIAQEEERGRISRELHDETAQTLSAFGLTLAALGQGVKNRPELTQLIDQLHTLNTQMSRGIYRLVHDLRPAQLDDLGLIPAIQHLIDEGQRQSGLKVSLEINGTRQRMDPLVETVFFRVVQEALTNVKRHADSKHAKVQFKFDPAKVELQVSDQGKGFDHSLLKEDRERLGLAGMEERTASVGGDFSIESAPNSGTMIKVIIPCKRAEEAQTSGGAQ